VATGQGCHLARQILYLLKQTGSVGCLGDGCGCGKRSYFRDPVGQLRGGVQIAFGLSLLYGLDVGLQPAGPDASQEVVRHIRCEALQVAQELGRFAVPQLFMPQELAHALITG